MRRSSFAAALACLLTGILLPAQLRSPKVGTARFPDGSVRPIFGLHSNFLLGVQQLPHSDCASFSDKGGLVSINGYIQLIGPDAAVLGEYESDETKPILDVEGELTGAIAWLPSRHSLIRWNGSTFAVTEVNGPLPGAVTSIRWHGQDTVDLFAVTSDAQVFEAAVSLDSGNFLSLNPVQNAKGYTFVQGAYLLFHDGKGLELQSADGSTKTLPIAASDLYIERMGTDWLHLYSSNKQQHWALHLNRWVSELSELPGIASNASAVWGSK